MCKTENGGEIRVKGRDFGTFSASIIPCQASSGKENFREIRKKGIQPYQPDTLFARRFCYLAWRTVPSRKVKRMSSLE